MELARFPSRGGFSVRSIFTFVLAVIATALLWTTFASATTHAADANWGGDAIIYQRHGYTAATDIKDTTGTIPDGATIYKSTLQTTGAGSSTSQKIFIIYFSSGVDPPTATSAEYVEFDYNNGTLSNPKNKKTLELELKSEQTMISSCGITGIGYVICPISNFMAEGMDTIFGWLDGFIETQPLMVGDTGNSMYIAWNMMRSIANVAFIIAFLVIIYSQITSFGLTNYGLKKLLPRLIIAAILVNLSYYIAAIAIDISNILGYSIQDLFEGIRQSVFHISEDNLGGANTSGTWAAITGVVLSGAGIVGGAYLISSGSIFLLFPILIGMLLTVLLVFIILAARQAIIVILVIIAPLAFVANLLPNTEKLFDKWKDLFMTMLVFFPAFSLVFAGSQLAGQVIIQNAGENLVMLIFGLAVQVAPLVITPLLIKLSGGLLGKVAQIANNPKKGLIDRNRNWANDRAALTRAKSVQGGMNGRNGKRRKAYNPTRWGEGLVRSSDFRKRRLKDATNLAETEATNRYEGTDKKYESIRARQAVADTNKSAIHDEHAAHDEKQKLRQGSTMHAAAMRATLAKEGLDTQQRKVTDYYDTLRTTGGTPLNASALNLATAQASAEAAEKHKEAYLNEQRTYRFTQLGAAAERLEAAKLNAEGWQNKYTAHIDSLKVEAAGVVPNPGLANAAVFAQSNKELAEAAQNRVQTMFDRDRKTAGTQLNASTISLEDSKLVAEQAKNLTASYINDEKSNLEGVLHVQTMRTERTKSVAKTAEDTLQQVIQEYKTGRLERTGELADIMEDLTRDTEMQAARARGIQAAQNIQQGNIARAFTETEPVYDATGNPVRDPEGNIVTRKTSRTEELLNIAGSVDEYGATRAQAAATSQLGKIQQEALANNIILLEDEAEAAGVNSIQWARNIFMRQIGTLPDPSDPSGKRKLAAQPQDPAMLEAAMEKLAKDGDIGTVREALSTKLGGSEDEYKPLMNRVIGRNEDTLKAKGGFDIQQKVGSLWGASQAEMDISIAGSLGAITADNIAGQKWGWWHSYTTLDDSGKTGLQRIVENSQDSPSDTPKQRADKKFARKMLQSFYGNLTTALTSQEIMTRIGDRKEETSDMHKYLQQVPGLIEDPIEINYDLTKRGLASPIPKTKKSTTDSANQNPDSYSI